MANEIDLCDISDTAEKMGFERADGNKYEIAPSTTLGTQNASPLTMASVAQTIANNGMHCPPTAIRSVTGVDGTKYKVPKSKCERAISADVAAGVTYAHGTRHLRRNGNQRGSLPVAVQPQARPAPRRTATTCGSWASRRSSSRRSGWATPSTTRRARTSGSTAYLAHPVRCLGQRSNVEALHGPRAQGREGDAVPVGFE